LSNVATDRILGRNTAGTGDSEQLTASEVRTLINVEDGATADQDLSGLLPKAGGTMTGNIALNGNYLSGDGSDEGVFVDSSGNVGIGTTSPAAGLHVQSAASTYGNKSFKLTDAAGASIITATGDGRVFVGSANGNNVAFSVDLSGAKTSGIIARFADGDGAIKLTSGSMVTDGTDFAFGSNSFGGALEFKSPINNGMLRIGGANTTIGQQGVGGTPDKTLRVVNKAAGGVTSFRVQEGASQSTSEVFGVYANDDSTPRLVVKSGNVGIGTTAPDTLLHNAGAYTQEPLSSDPADPDAGNSVQWVSSGVGSGDAGDVMMKINVGGTTKVITLIDYSVA